MKKKFNCSNISKRGCEFPRNLIAYPDNVKFAVDFLLNQDKDAEVLQKIAALCATTKENVELWFCHSKTPLDIANYLKRDANYNDFKSFDLSVSEHIANYQPYADSASIRYINVRFVG